MTLREAIAISPGPVPGTSYMEIPGTGIAVVSVHYTARPDMTEERVEAERKRYPTEARWDQEMEGDAHALEGQLVYPEFNASIHVIPDNEIPVRGCVFLSIDPHPRTPHAFLWIKIDRWSDWYCYRELWPSKVYGKPKNLKKDEQENTYTIREYAETLAVLEGNTLEWHKAEQDEEYATYKRARGGENVIYRFMDQAGKGFKASDESGLLESYARRYDRFGIQCVDPYKSHKSGEDAVRDLLKLRHHDIKGVWPRLHIAASCVELIHEFSTFRYKSMRWTDEKELPQEGIEARTHQIDNLRYIATGRVSYVGSMES